MTKPLIIGLTGYKRSGKDTVAKILHNKLTNLEYDVKKYMLASLIKTTLSNLTGLNLKQLEQIKDNPVMIDPLFTYRDVLIAIADRYKEKYDINVHYEYMRHHILNDQPDIAIITDIRYPYEADLIKKDFSNVCIIKIYRPDVKVDTSHSSETSVKLIDEDTVIINDGSIKDLENKVDAIIGNYLNDKLEIIKKSI